MHISPLINRGIEAAKLEALPKRLKEIVPDTKLFKEMTTLDKNCIVNYINAKSYKIGITAEDIEQLSKFDGDDFIVNAYNFLSKKLGLTNDIRPAICPMPIQGDAVFCYLPTVNVIYADLEKCKKFNQSKSDLISLLRHEMQHFLQYSMILRHETLGEKIISKLADDLTIATKKNLLDLFSANPSVPLEQMVYTPEALELLNKAKICIDKNDMEGLHKLCNQQGEIQKALLLEYRQKLIGKMGLIKKDSALTERAQQIYDEFLNIGYFNQDGIIDLKKYLASKIETDAILSQLQTQLEYNQAPCGVKYFRDVSINAYNDPMIADKFKSLET